MGLYTQIFSPKLKFLSILKYLKIFSNFDNYRKTSIDNYSKTWTGDIHFFSTHKFWITCHRTTKKAYSDNCSNTSFQIKPFLVLIPFHNCEEFRKYFYFLEKKLDCSMSALFFWGTHDIVVRKRFKSILTDFSRSAL